MLKPQLRSKRNLTPKREYINYRYNIENQRKVITKIYNKLQLTHLSELLNLQRDEFVQAGGKYLLYVLYKNNYQRLLASIFSNYPWSSLHAFNSSLMSSHSHFLSLENQREFMNGLYRKYQFSDFDEFTTKISKLKILRNRGHSLLMMYDNQIPKLMRGIYPRYPFEFPPEKISPKYSFVNEYHQSKIKLLIDEYFITQKSDWYRLESRAGNCNVFSLIKLFYKRDHWSKEQFFTRGKKSNQRKLYIHLLKSFPHFYVLENYRHQKIQLLSYYFY